MEGLITSSALLAACLGWGLAALRLLRVRPLLAGLEHTAWAAIIGMGLSGWLAFPTALVLGATRLSAMVVVAVGLALLAMLRHDLASSPGSPAGGTLTSISWALLAAAAAVAAMDAAAALVPPVDADSMAYHFALPKHFLAAGQIEFLPQAVEAAIPLVFHMTYMQAMALGGESALTLWCGLSAWFLPLAAFATARRHMSLEWALALMVAVKSLPAVVYGSPAGQIEVRLASMFLVASVSTARARPSDDWRPAALAGLAAGLCAGAKYSGLVAPVVCGAMLLGGPARFPRMLAFGTTTLLAGGQWYLWNWLHTGDPLFPLLWGTLPYSPSAHWDEGMSAAVRQSIQGELGVTKSLAWLLLYPLKATFDGLPIFESGRTGFGVLPVLLLPFALVGWHRRPCQPGDSGELGRILFVCLLGYALWFLGGSSQRVRHFLPELVPILIVMLAASVRTSPASTRPLAAGLGLAIAVQLGGQLIYSQYNLLSLFRGTSRADYLGYNLAAYPLVQWLNSHLGPADKVLMTEREVIFHLDVPVYYSPPTNDGRVRLTPPKPSAAEYLRELRAQGISHLSVNSGHVYTSDDGQADTRDIGELNTALVDQGCASIEAIIPTPPMLQSRTLRIAVENGWVNHFVIALTRHSCALDPGEENSETKKAP